MKVKKVLIAEHDPLNTELLIEELNVVDPKMEILLKKDGLELMDFFNRSDIGINVGAELQIDLIIMGHGLPEIHGMEVLRYLKGDSRYMSIPIIIFLNTSDNKAILEVYENGAHDYIKKPASFKEFKENIKKFKRYLLN